MSLWGDTEQDNDGPKPEGDYIATLETPTLNTKDDKGNDLDVININLQFNIEGPKYKGAKLFLRVNFRESAAKFLSWQLGVLGAWSNAKDAKTFTDAASMVMADLANNTTKYVMEVTHREYNGKTYENAIVREEYVGQDLLGSVPNHAPQTAAPKGVDTGEEIPF